MIERLAQRAYEAYAANTQWKSLATGSPLPQWDDLSEAIQEAWKASVADCQRLRHVVMEFVGADDPQELAYIELTLRTAPIPESERVGLLNLIHALREIR
ncbi:MAG: hypothetical protein U0930_20035 [Pirellulales bacterium]